MYSKVIATIVILIGLFSCPTSVAENNTQQYFKIEGRIESLPHESLDSFQTVLKDVKILVNHGQYTTMPNEMGGFEIEDLPSDSYVVEVTHSRYIYDPVRVDITSKGKIRARLVDYMQPLKNSVPYPISFKPKAIHNYFVPKETWRLADVLLNPMVILMVVPLIILGLCPKMINQEQNQIQQAQPADFNMPELSELMTTTFSRAGTSQGDAGQSNSGGSTKSNKVKKVKAH